MGYTYLTLNENKGNVVRNYSKLLWRKSWNNQ